MVHRWYTPDEKKMVDSVSSVPPPAPNVKQYTKKELVMAETSVFDFHTSFYTPEIQKI